MSLSVVIITYNEAKNIARCLASVQNVADEILVIDSYSTDGTQNICQQFNTRFLQHEFKGYGEQKQYAVRMATFDYILSLDADEELSPELQRAIAQEKLNWQSDCYTFNRKTFYCLKPILHCGWYPDKQMRLFNRKSARWDDRKVHEKILIDESTRPLHLAGDLNHYTCSSIAEHQDKERKYARMNADILIDKKKRILPWTPYIKGLFRFFKIYVLKLGVLDGYYGFVISKTLATSSYWKYKWAQQRNAQ
jgi:glycosyltransferase involved in cell wall biosynthesis